jgi:hypothetical protein
LVAWSSDIGGAADIVRSLRGAEGVATAAIFRTDGGRLTAGIVDTEGDFAAAIRGVDAGFIGSDAGFAAAIRGIDVGFGMGGLCDTRASDRSGTFAPPASVASATPGGAPSRSEVPTFWDIREQRYRPRSGEPAGSHARTDFDGTSPAGDVHCG